MNIISGTVTGTDEVTVTLSGDAEDSQSVDDGKSYSFTVSEGGSYTVTPTKQGCTFTPESKTFGNVTSVELVGISFPVALKTSIVSSSKEKLHALKVVETSLAKTPSLQSLIL